MNGSGHLYIEESVVETINRYRQDSPKAHEAGGLLAGYYKGKDLHVIKITTPQPKDKSGKYYFHRRDLRHVEQITDWYKNSNGRINCLGEWHSHPETLASPSDTDINEWRKLIHHRGNLKTIFLIVGLENLWVGTLQAPI